MHRKVAPKVPSLFALLGTIGLLGGCSGASGNVQYFLVAAQQATFVQAGAQNCAGSETNNVAVVSFTGIDGLGTWAIYAAPSVGGQAQYLLDDGSGNLLQGALTSGIYTFSGVYTHEVKPQTTGPDVTNVTKETVTLTLSGDGFTGTVAVELVCSETGGSHECGPPVGAQAGSGYDCTTQYAITGTQVSPTAAEAGANPTSPAPQPGEAGGGGGMPPGGGGGAAGFCQTITTGLSAKIGDCSGVSSKNCPEAACESAYGQCTASDQSILDSMGNCVSALPACQSAQQSTWTGELISCADKLSSLSAACSAAVNSCGS